MHLWTNNLDSTSKNMAEASSTKLPQKSAPRPTKVRKPWQSGQYTVYLWEFLYGLLQDPECSTLIRWINKENKEFRINNTHEIAKLWGTVKNRPTMDDKKLLRALRYYYKTKILRKVKGHKGVYQFLSIPYETEGCDQQVNSSEKNSAPPLACSTEHSLKDSNGITPDCSERLTGTDDSTTNYCGTAVDDGSRTEIHREETVHNCEQADDSFEECCGYRSRAETSTSESSISTDSSTTKSLDELQADILNSDVFDHVSMTENMDFVLNDESDVGQHQNGDMLNW